MEHETNGLVLIFLGEVSACRQDGSLRPLSAAAPDRLSTRSGTVHLAGCGKVRHYSPMRGHSWSDRHHTAYTCAEQRVQSVTVGRPMGRRLRLATVTAMLGLMPMACAYQGLTMASVTAMTLHGDGTLIVPTPESTSGPNTGTLAYTYNPALAPAGARLNVVMTPSDETTTAELTVSGLVPNRGYAVHANVNACSPNSAAEGPRYQNRVDPTVNPTSISGETSTNPEYANPRNEVWLDVHTDVTGSGTSRTTVPFVFTDRGPGSIVVEDATDTATGLGKAAKEGARIACLSLSAVQPRDHPRGSA
jgi:Cu-Zn family superoxide dismutase